MIQSQYFTNDHLVFLTGHTVTFLFATLLTASLMWPSEGAIHGDGLYLSALWCAAGGMALWFQKPTQLISGSLSFRRWLAVLSVPVLLAGFWLSTWKVFDVNGDRRSALNLTFEWTALAAIWVCAKLLGQSRGTRQLVTVLLVALGAGAAVLGLVQHYVLHPDMAQWYQRQMEQVDANVEGWAATQNSARRELELLNIPTSGPGRELFERRLLHSTEPIGPFALANSLAGVLAACLMLIYGMLSNGLRQKPTEGLLAKLLAVLVAVTMTYCLVLTKSRTAWAGSMAGIVYLALQQRRISEGSRSGILKILTAIFLIAGTTFGAGIATGALDKEVLLESPRSLQFRLLYWMGAAEVIEESPVWGTGPGNFRQVYLKHKAAESSEEILDPHNIFVDAWSSLGLFGLVGVCCLVASGLLPSTSNANKASDSRAMADLLPRRPGLKLSGAILAGLVIHVGWFLFQGGDFRVGKSERILAWDNGLPIIPYTALIVAPLLMRLPPPSESAIKAAFVAMIVHLLGAGGMQISGLMTVLLILHAMATTTVNRQQVSDGTPVRSQYVGQRFAAVVFLVSVAAIVFWGAIPRHKGLYWAKYSSLKQAQNDLSAASKMSERAIQEDPCSVEFRQQKSELLAYKLSQELQKGDQFSSEPPSSQKHASKTYSMLQQAISEQIAADRRNWTGYELRRQAAQMYASATGDENAGQTAIEALSTAVSLYPTNATLLSQLSILHSQQNHPHKAEDAAVRALEQDRINREWGHIDRFLEPETISKLTSILTSIRTSSPADGSDDTTDTEQP